MNKLILNLLDKSNRDFLSIENTEGYEIIDWQSNPISGLGVSSFPCALVAFPATGNLPAGEVLLGDFSSSIELDIKIQEETIRRGEEGAILPPPTPVKDVMGFLTLLKSNPNLPIEILPFLSLWSPEQIENDVSRWTFWGRVKTSGASFITPEIISSIEAVALSFNLPLNPPV